MLATWLVGSSLNELIPNFKASRRLCAIRAGGAPALIPRQSFSQMIALRGVLVLQAEFIRLESARLGRPSV
jgi:hypothetical protein